MPVILSQFANDEIDVRYKEEFLTESLNVKVGGGIIPTGIHSGFYLTTSGASLSITVTDSIDGESCAVVTSGGGEFALTLRRAGDLVVDLSSQVSTTVAICLFANYTSAGTTTADIRAYETSPVDELTGIPELSDLVVLGQVEVPAAGVIPGSSITPWQRVPAAGRLLPGQLPQTSLVQNPAFAFGDVGSAYSLNTPPWEWESGSPSDALFRCSNTNVSPIQGTGQYQTVDVLNATPVTLSIYQNLSHPYIWGGVADKGLQQVNVYAVIGVNSTTVGGTAQIAIQTMDTGGDVTAGAETIALDLSAPGLFFINEAITVSISNDVFLSRIAIEFNSVEWNSTGEQVDIYYLQAQVVDREYFSLTDKDLKDFRLFQTILGGRMALFDWESLDGSTFSPIPGNARSMLLDFISQGTEAGNPLLKLLRLDRTDEDNTNIGVSLEMHGHIESLHEGDVSNGLRDTPAIQSVFAASSPFTLFWESQSSLGPGVSHPSLRIYSSNFGEMWLTSNAYFDPAGPDLWRKDTSGNSNAVVLTNTEGVQILKEDSALQSTTWVTGDWRESIELGDTASGSLVSIGEGWADTADAGDLTVPRVDVEFSNANRTLLLKSEDSSSTTAPIRVYLGGDDFAGFGDDNSFCLEITSNAFYDNDTGLWDKDEDSLSASKLYVNRNNLGMVSRDTGAGTWADSGGDSGTGWSKSSFDLGSLSSSPFLSLAGDLPGGNASNGRFILFLDSTPDLVLRNGRLRFQNRDSSGAQIALTSHANPTNPTVRNGLTPKQVVKAWANIEVPSGSGAPIVQGNFNVASCVRNGLLGFVVNFDDQISDTTTGDGDVVQCPLACVTELGWMVHPFQDSAPPVTLMTCTIVDDNGTNINVGTTSNDLRLFVMTFCEDTGL